MEQTKTYRKYKENSKDRFVRYSEGAECETIFFFSLANIYNMT